MPIIVDKLGVFENIVFLKTNEFFVSEEHSFFNNLYTLQLKTLSSFKTVGRNTYSFLYIQQAFDQKPSILWIDQAKRFFNPSS